MRSKRYKESPLAEKVEPIRAILRALIRSRIKTKADQERLAEYLGMSVASVVQMIYNGEGGMNAWLGALMHCYSLDAEDVAKFFSDWQATLRKMNPVSESDREWFALGEKLTEEEKLYWVKLIHVASEMEKDLAKPKRRR